MSTNCQKTTATAIPSTRRVIINDAAHMPHDYSTTPGGTLFSTTPGGTHAARIQEYMFVPKTRTVTHGNKSFPRSL
ncbi:hypothetical protein LDENG_00166850 [Lucifuga dentata]|nr:hypothetical protein LDENG_00166850 [Lucifuga dentata]